MDDVKVSHKDAKVVEEVVNLCKKHFGDFEVSRGKSHDYLGMKLTIGDDKKLCIDMRPQIKQAIESFGENIEGEVSTPAAKHLFDVNPDDVPLSPSKQEIFHSVTAKLLYLEKRARPDIETAIGFLTTRVASPGEDDWKKL